MRRLLLVDDDPKLCDITGKYLAHAGFEVAVARDGRQARERVAREAFDLVVLDVMLPDTTGFAWLKELRGGRFAGEPGGSAPDVPVVLLTALGRTPDVLTGLRSGADDYVTKPYDPSELVERIRTVLKRAGGGAHDALALGNLRIDLATRLARCGGKELPLQRRELDLLVHLARNAGRALTREALLDAVWGVDFDGSDRAVDICVTRVRAKLAEAGAVAAIRTVRGTGYRLEVPR